MEALAVILSIIGFIFSILSIVLFFKVWGLCDDTEEMKYLMIKVVKLLEEQQKEENAETTEVASEKKVAPKEDETNYTGVIIGAISIMIVMGIILCVVAF
ncbi:MAG: hypothetical protein J6U91_01715 [Alistipes sp.]|nr:hypothetical protein [Alistipes sp.]